MFWEKVVISKIKSKSKISVHYLQNGMSVMVDVKYKEEKCEYMILPFSLFQGQNEPKSTNLLLNRTDRKGISCISQEDFKLLHGYQQPSG